ncbi:MAG: PorT family protein [Bacteroidales bacterium]|jgi:hypothetical protein|nr:PorT family protein [Bacteroidales bacterium]
MKRILFLLLTSALFITANAQNSIGIRGGYSQTSIKFEKDYGQTALTGDYTTGIVFRRVDSTKRSWVSLGIQVEVNYSRKGFNQIIEEANGSVPAVSITRNMEYINTPIVTQILIGPKRIKLSLNFGVYFAYMLSLKDNLKSTGNAALSQDSEIYYDAYNRFDYGIVPGAGLALDLNIFYLQLEARYSFGFGNLYKEDQKYLPSTSRFKSLELSASVLYKF